MTRIKKILVSAVVLFSVASWAQTDEELAKQLIGHWEELRVVGCEVHQQRMRVKTDGTFEVNGTIDACNKRTFFVWRGTWKVNKKHFLYTTTYSNTPSEYPNGESFEDQIISVSSTEWVMIEQSTGHQSNAKRIP